MTETETTCPLVSVVVCTKNRPQEVLRAATSILGSDYPDFELLIVDESDDDATASALAPLLHRSSRLRYFPLANKGKAGALNHAWRRARGQYLSLTDDDCEMAPDCLSMLMAIFHANPTVGIVFGDVAAARCDSAYEHIPKCHIREPNTIRHPAHLLRITARRATAWLNFGIGANMAIKSTALLAIDGWDPCIGPGEKFGSGDDHDLAFRLLRAGYGLHFCPAARVVHHGARQLASKADYSRRVGRGFGAACVKHLKCGVLYHGSARTLPFHFMRFCLESLHLRRTDSASFIGGWFSGFFGGLRHPVNRRTLRFEDKRALSNELSDSGTISTAGSALGSPRKTK